MQKGNNFAFLIHFCKLSRAQFLFSFKCLLFKFSLVQLVERELSSEMIEALITVWSFIAAPFIRFMWENPMFKYKLDSRMLLTLHIILAQILWFVYKQNESVGGGRKWSFPFFVLIYQFNKCSFNMNFRLLMHSFILDRWNKAFAYKWMACGCFFLRIASFEWKKSK